jgi:DnaK suppressor protein
MSAKKRKEYFKILLSQRLDELLTEAKKTASGRTVPQDESPDFTDEASIESERDLVFRIKERESGLIRKIKDALMRLEDGTFGICQECGGEISEKRLEARPIAALCIKCKEEQETEEKVRSSHESGWIIP